MCVNSKQFEVITPVKELLIQFNVFRNVHSDNKDTQKLLKQFISEELINGNENTYFRNYIKHTAYLSVYE